MSERREGVLDDLYRREQRPTGRWMLGEAVEVIKDNATEVAVTVGL